LEPGAACAGCVVRHWCAGGCSDETYATTGRIDCRPTDCSDLREAVIEMMWMIAARPNLVKRKDKEAVQR